MEERIKNTFKILLEHGFECEFLCFTNVSFTDECAIAFYKESIYFVVHFYKNHFFEPPMFYKVYSPKKLNPILSAIHPQNNINVEQYDKDLWNFYAEHDKLSNYFGFFELVAESIERQINQNNSFYGIDV